MAAQACRQAQSRGGGPAGPPALAAVVAVSEAARHGGGQAKPCAAPPIPHPAISVVHPPAAVGQLRCLSSSLLSASVEDIDGNVDSGTPLLLLSSLMTTTMKTMTASLRQRRPPPSSLSSSSSVSSSPASASSLASSALSRHLVVPLSATTAFAAPIALVSIIAAAVVVAANAATAALRRWLVVVSPTPLSADRFVIRRFCHRAITNTFAAGRRPLSPNFASRCLIHRLCRSH